MKDFLLIDIGLSLKFWAEVIDTANYLRQNFFLTKSQIDELIPVESWTREKEDVSRIIVFKSNVSVVIPKEKNHKSDIYKN